MPGGDCFSLLRMVGCLPCDDVRRFAADIVLALEYLHSLGIGAVACVLCGFESWDCLKGGGIPQQYSATSV